MRKGFVCLLGLSFLWGCAQPTFEKAEGGLGARIVSIVSASQQRRAAHLSSPNRIAVKIFQADNQCDRLISQTEYIPPSKAKLAATALQSVMSRQRIDNFKVARYKLSVTEGTATVDIQVAPSSLRQITSLSSCEQFALFSAIKATLTKNKSLQIDQVRFTQSGEEVYL